MCAARCRFGVPKAHGAHPCPQVGVTKWLKQLETVFYSAGISFDKVGTWLLRCSSFEAS